MTHLPGLPLACSLTTTELRDREARLLAQFRSAVVETEELPNGCAFHIPGDAQGIRLVAELMVAERECCPFLTFELAAEPNKGPMTVRVTSPSGGKEFFTAILGKMDHSA